MSEHNLIAVTFTEPSKAYEALSQLKGAGFEGRVGVRAAAVVVRDEQGRLSVPEGVDDEGGAATWGGGLVGMTVGILGGPVGMLFGWTTGMLVGGAFDLTRAGQGSDLLDGFARTVPSGATAVVAEVDEASVEVIDAAMGALGGSVYRRGAEDVLAELESAQDAYEEAQEAARRVARQERKAERKADFEERKNVLKEKLGISS